MQKRAATVEEYIQSLPEERQEAIRQLRQVILENLPADFNETMSSDMIHYVVPHSVYPAGYHCDPKQPLPFMSLAAQKNFIALYHMGIYANPELLEWFQKAYAERVPTKLDMGKSCVRFKDLKKIPYDLMGELAGKMTAREWIQVYEENVKR